MAKLKAPLLSLGASQQIGKSLVFYPWKGLDVVREYVIPSNPKTSGQTTQRGYMTEAVAQIHELQGGAAAYLHAIDVQAYALWASVVQAATTWFNQAVRNWIDQRVAGLAGNIFYWGSTTPGADQLGVIVLNGPTVITAGTFKYGTSKTALIHSEAANCVAGSSDATLTGLTTGVKYYWQFVPSAPASCVGQKSGIYYGVPT